MKHWQHRRVFAADTREEVSKQISAFIRTIPGAAYETSPLGGQWIHPDTQKVFQHHAILYFNIFQEELCTTITA